MYSLCSLRHLQVTFEKPGVPERVRISTSSDNKMYQPVGPELDLMGNTKHTFTIGTVPVEKYLRISFVGCTLGDVKSGVLLRVFLSMV